MIVPIKLLITLLLLAGVAALQIFLSSRESRWPGLVLPVIGFIFGLLSVKLGYPKHVSPVRWRDRRVHFSTDLGLAVGEYPHRRSPGDLFRLSR